MRQKAESLIASCIKRTIIDRIVTPQIEVASVKDGVRLGEVAPKGTRCIYMAFTADHSRRLLYIGRTCYLQNRMGLHRHEHTIPAKASLAVFRVPEHWSERRYKDAETTMVNAARPPLNKCYRGYEAV